jgi:hypothetical protein
MKTKSFASLMPMESLKKLPRQICLAINESRYCLTGDVNWVDMTVKDLHLQPMDRTGKTFKGIPSKWLDGLPQSVTLTIAVGEKETDWEVSWTEWNAKAFTIQDIVIGRIDGKNYSVIMASETPEPDCDYYVSIMTGFGYACPIRTDIIGSEYAERSGRRPIVLETLGGGKYVGQVFAGLVYTDQWMVVTQNETKLGPDGMVVPTRRMDRRSVSNPDAPDIENAIAFPGYPVCLDPHSIAAAENFSKEGWVIPILCTYHQPYQVDDKHELVDVDTFLGYGDGPGTVGFFQWLMLMIRDGHIELKPSIAIVDVPFDPAVSYGYPINVGVVTHLDGTLSVIRRDGYYFDRQGIPYESLRQSGFDPATVPTTPIIHHVGTLDLNTKRISSTTEAVALHPLVVYEYVEQSLPEPLNFVTESLQDIWEDGDGPAQAVLANFIWRRHVTNKE